MKRKPLIIYLLIFIVIAVFIYELYNKEEETEEITSKEGYTTSAFADENPKKKIANLPFSPLEVHYIDVGQGDATLLSFKNDDNESFHILFDVGDWKGDEVVPYLREQQIEAIDLIMISHPHADHIGQLKPVLEKFPVEEIWMTENKSESKVFQSALQAILDSDAAVHIPKVKEHYSIDQLELTILHPDSLTGDLNADSLSARITYGDISFIFTGDAYHDGERQMVERTKNIEAQFLQLGHHGSSTSSHPSFVKAVNPSYAIYSAAKDNSYGHPHVETVDLFNEMNIPLYGTDVHGTIIVTTDGVEASIQTEKADKVSKNNHKNNSNKCIDINKASLKQLQEIRHLNEERAKELIDLRPFNNINELRKIYGIGKGRLRDIKEENLACISD